MLNQIKSGGQIVYEVSRRPQNKHLQMTKKAGIPLFTPSGGRVPPAWTQVWVTTDANSPLQATGRDSKNRRVYLYSAAFTGKTAAVKFARLKEFAKVYPKLMRRIKQDMHTSEEALVLYLIAKTGFRIGGNAETKAAAKAFGASTLRCAHVAINENKLGFIFTGKKGIRVDKELQDKFLAQAINGRCEEKISRKIFNTNDDKIRTYLDAISGSKGFTVKDFRTYLGTLTAFKKIRTMTPPHSAQEFKRFRKEVGRTVAGKLGNSPTIALNSYVAPEVFCAWEGNAGSDEAKSSQKRASLATDFLECVHYARGTPADKAENQPV
jgi:DNA topoisomerase-1